MEFSKIPDHNQKDNVKKIVKWVLTGNLNETKFDKSKVIHRLKLLAFTGMLSLPVYKAVEKYMGSPDDLYNAVVYGEKGEGSTDYSENARKYREFNRELNAAVKANMDTLTKQASLHRVAFNGSTYNRFQSSTEDQIQNIKEYKKIYDKYGMTFDIERWIGERTDADKIRAYFQNQ